MVETATAQGSQEATAATWQIEPGRLVDAAMALLMSVELPGKVMDQCLQFFGDWRWRWELPITPAFVDLRTGRIGGGSVEVTKQIIARSTLPGHTKRGC